MNKLRLAVFRSNKYIYGQIIDDEKKQTLVSLNDLSVSKDFDGLNKNDKARKVGKLLAEKALKQKITEVVFDRGKFRYHGRVKSLAEGAREGGLKF